MLIQWLGLSPREAIIYIPNYDAVLFYIMWYYWQSNLKPIINFIVMDNIPTLVLFLIFKLTYQLKLISSFVGLWDVFFNLFIIPLTK